MPYTCFAVAAPGLEPIVARELTLLGERPRIEDGGVSWLGDARSMMRANLWLRSASRVVVRVARFRATAFYELEKRAKKVEWARFVGPDVSADFRVTTHKSKLHHSDAIAERLQSAVGPRPSPGANAQLFIVRVVRDKFEISADTSGALLHMRGYRAETGKAPMRETLAAALLLAAEWSGEVPLLDPFCGSGTIPIEAALIARRIAPGRSRDFAFMRSPDFDASAWHALRGEADALRRPATASIRGSDRDAGAIAAAIANAARAGVEKDIVFERQPISAVTAPGDSGLMATNPPYGVRVSRSHDVRNLYAQLGNVLRRSFAGWRLAAYVPTAQFARQLGLTLTTLYRTTNGGISVAALAATVPDAASRD